MYKQRIIYDSSCHFYNNNLRSSVKSNALFDLTTDYIYVLSGETIKESNNDIGIIQQSNEEFKKN